MGARHGYQLSHDASASSHGRLQHSIQLHCAEIALLLSSYAYVLDTSRPDEDASHKRIIAAIDSHLSTLTTLASDRSALGTATRRRRCALTGVITEPRDRESVLVVEDQLGVLEARLYRRAHTVMLPEMHYNTHYGHVLRARVAPLRSRLYLMT